MSASALAVPPTQSGAEAFRTGAGEQPRSERGRLIFLPSGAMGTSATSSAEPARLWAATPDRFNATASGAFGSLAAAHADTHEITQRAISELRRISGLTWSQLGKLFGVSQRSVHFWASGKPLNTNHEKRLLRILDIVRAADKGDARTNRAAIFEAKDGSTAFELLAAERFDDAQTLLGKGIGQSRPTPPKLSAAEKAARRPLTPEELIDAQHDSVHHNTGRSRVAHTVRNKRREDT